MAATGILGKLPGHGDFVRRGGPAEVLGMLETQVHGWDTALGLGTANRGRFRDAGIDALIQQARQTMDNDTRARLTREATRQAIRERTALIPLYFQVNTWAMRRGVRRRITEITLRRMNP